MSHSPHSSTPHAARFRSRKLAFDRSWLVPFRLIAACSILWFPSKLRRLWSLNFMRSYFSFESKGDPLFFLTHRYYLSKTLTVAQRIDCAVAHYSFEGRTTARSITALSISRPADSRFGIEWSTVRVTN